MAQVTVRREVRPPWPYRLPRAGVDGVLRSRGGVLERLLHVDGAPAVVRAVQPRSDSVVLEASAQGADVAEEAIARMRFALAVDDELREFHDAFCQDPLIGRSVRTRPQLRILRRPEPFEALAWAICEQLIEFREAIGIERRIVDRLGRSSAQSPLRDLPEPATLAAQSPAALQALGLSAGRAGALRRAAHEVARGRVDLRGSDPEAGWRRLRAIPGIGRWTVDVLALHGQGCLERIPAGDLAYLKWAGPLLHGHPRARASEEEVRELFAPYGRWAGLAGAHALGASAGAATLRATPPPFGGATRRPPRQPSRRPGPAGTRSSAPGPRWRAA